MSADIVISISISGGRTPNEDRLALADRYDDRAGQAIDRRERAALFGEADRIRSEETGR